MQIPEQTAERAAFEVWFCADGNYEQEWLDGRVVAGEFLYSNADTENMWQAFRAALATTKATAPVAWQPTAENINALPQPVRDYIHGLVANTDPAGMVRENSQLRDTNEGLQRMYRRAADALDEVRGCFRAAEIEGLAEAISETSDERLKDLIERRVMHALYAAQAVCGPAPVEAIGEPVAERRVRELEEEIRAIEHSVMSIGIERSTIRDACRRILAATPATPSSQDAPRAVPAGLSDAQLADAIPVTATVSSHMAPRKVCMTKDELRQFLSNVAALAASAPGAPDLAQPQPGTGSGS